MWRTGGQRRLADDIETGLAWCENALLDEIAPEINNTRVQSLSGFLRKLLDSDADSNDLMSYFERVEVRAGAALIDEGAPSDDIYFVEAGHASVTIKGTEGSVHLAKIGPGAIVGEVAFYLGGARTASVIAEDGLVAWRFGRSRLRELVIEKPVIASRLHEGLAAILAHRLASTNRLVRFIAD